MTLYSITNHQTCFAAHNSVFQNVCFVYEAVFDPCVDPCVGLGLPEDQVRLTAKPEGTFEEEGTDGGPCQGLLKRSRCLLKTQGARCFLWPCDKQQPCKDKTEQMDEAESREMNTSS